jgi:ribosomal-protein-alanine N-acetyltransferase
MPIRPLRVDDADELARLLVRNRAFLKPFEPPREQSFWTAAGQRERLAADDSAFAFAILDAQEIAGVVRLTNVIRGPLQSANVGYWVDHARNGRGLATAAVADAVAFAFEDAGLHRVEAGTLLDNVASQRVLEKNGFERIGVARRYLLIGGDWRDHVLFQRTRD